MKAFKIIFPIAFIIFLIVLGYLACNMKGSGAYVMEQNTERHYQSDISNIQIKP